MSLTDQQIKEYIYESTEIMGIYQFAKRAGFGPDFADQAPSLQKFFEAAEINDLSEMKEILMSQRPLVEKFLVNLYSARLNPWRVTLEFICALTLTVNQPDVFTKEWFVEEAGWDNQIVDIIISALHKSIPC